METTTATYQISVTTDDENIITFYKTMPTRPKTSKGVKSQNAKLSKWVEKNYPNFTEYDILPAFEATTK
jgi:ABC-type tungstate transport system permease subunit